jgi:xylulokinase
MGERSPLNDSYAESCFIGMSMSTAREDMTQAVFEGVAFAIRDCLEAAKKQGVVITSTTVCGGGMKSTLWRRIFANVLNIDLKLPATVQGPGYGAAMLAAVAAGEWNSVEQAADQIVTMKETDQPEPELAALYEKRYQMWHQLYPSLKESFRAMGDLR